MFHGNFEWCKARYWSKSLWTCGTPGKQILCIPILPIPFNADRISFTIRLSWSWAEKWVIFPAKDNFTTPATTTPISEKSPPPNVSSFYFALVRSKGELVWTFFPVFRWNCLRPHGVISPARSVNIFWWTGLKAVMMNYSLELGSLQVRSLWFTCVYDFVQTVTTSLARCGSLDE